MLKSNIYLNHLRNILIRQEESIIFSFVERARFLQNTPVYQAGAIPINLKLDSPISFLAFFLLKTEEVHALTRRYVAIDEIPFNKNLPDPVIPCDITETPLAPIMINKNKKLLSYYIDTIIPQICDHGDCENYGSSVQCDVIALQALSYRLHFGKFIAEAKFRSDTPLYTELIQKQDAEGIMNRLVNRQVEEELLNRVYKKSKEYSKHAIEDIKRKSNFSKTMLQIYKNFIIPLTCEIEVDYLLQRLNYPK